jgi:nitroimidazol reductase NimA-like FMN-containing flavoprotein (pyridoxamine 5'-phosphate oxidase superfamily)
MPDGYGVPETDEGLLPWSWATRRLEAALNYWLGTTRPDGRPHAMPAWAVWLDDALYLEGSPATRRARNLAKNPEMVVHLESGDEVVILPAPDQWDQGGLWVMRPRVAFGWSEFPRDVTRWSFNRPAV